jgi:selenoprotein W-related protein
VAALQEELGVAADMKVGPTGSFIVDVDGKVVAEKRVDGFPSEEEIVSAVGRALGKKR